MHVVLHNRQEYVAAVCATDGFRSFAKENELALQMRGQAIGVDKVLDAEAR